jgi:F-type H+-transporting ATPase subunit epsilon
MANTILLEVVTPAKAVLDVKATEVVLPGIQGELGILPGHLPLLTALDVGTMVVKMDGKSRSFVLDGGFAEILREKITVLTEACEGVDDIDIEHARQVMAQAEKDIKELEERSKSEPIEPDVMEQHRKMLKQAQTRLLLGQSKSKD